LRYFYPTDTLVTGPDIIFFWVARMIMSGLKFGPTFTGTTAPEKNIPFRDVYFTSIIRDEKGRKMSKSLGNSPEPLDLIEEYGADAVRFTILYLSPLGQDVFYSKEKNEIGRNFANKIWNAGRFLLLNKDQTGEAARQERINLDHQDLADRWIVSRYQSTLKDVSQGLAEFEVNRISKAIYDFLWHDFCDWYVEMIKSRLYGPEPVEVKQAVISRALDIFEGGLRLLHPLMPFVTEELWHHVRSREDAESIMRTALGTVDESLIDLRVEAEMAFVQNVIEAIRGIRGEMKIPPATGIDVILKSGSSGRSKTIGDYLGYLQRLARVRSLSVIDSGPRPPQSASAVVDGEELFIPLEGLIDVDVERTRIEKEIERISGIVAGTRKKLENSSFLERAPEEIIKKEKDKLESMTTTLRKLEGNLKGLVGTSHS
jgi:valyl-tRNA synthetase